MIAFDSDAEANGTGSSQGVPLRVPHAGAGTPETWQGAWVLRTVSGSVYLVARDASGDWWLIASNVPSVRSVELPAGVVWPMDAPTPWPPVISEPIALLAPRQFAFDDPRRMPGGGKITSAVIGVAELNLRGNTSAEGLASNAPHTKSPRDGELP